MTYGTPAIEDAKMLGVMVRRRFPATESTRKTYFDYEIATIRTVLGRHTYSKAVIDGIQRIGIVSSDRARIRRHQ